MQMQTREAEGQTLAGGVYALVPERRRLHWKRRGAGKEHKHNHGVTREQPCLKLTACLRHHTGVHTVTDGAQRGMDVSTSEL